MSLVVDKESVEVFQRNEERTADTSGGVNATKYVSWDGPEDPTHPRNWSLLKKWSQILLVSLITFMTCE